MEWLVVILAIAGMLAMAVGTGLMVRTFWRVERDALRRSPPTAARLALRLAILAAFAAPGVTLLILAPWGSDSDAAVLLGYMALVVLAVLGLSVYEARRSRARLASRRRRAQP
jgi:hypothetical protein